MVYMRRGSKRAASNAAKSSRSLAKPSKVTRDQVARIRERREEIRQRAGVLSDSGQRPLTLICVVDASVVLKWFLPEPDSATADILLEKFLNDEVELLAPDLMLVATASALWKRVMIRKELSADEATLIYRDLLTLPLSFIGSGTLAEAAFRVALKHSHSVYDALSCALAIDRRDFVTADRALANIARRLPIHRPSFGH